MTREEAKRIAMGLRTDFKCESDTMVDFCDTIIKALEQEPCEDAISRQTAIDLEELRHRFGSEVAFVVEDMIKGTSERWGKE